MSITKDYFLFFLYLNIVEKALFCERKIAETYIYQGLKEIEYGPERWLKTTQKENASTQKGGSS